MSEKPTREQNQVMIDRVHKARMNAEQFIHAGGDLNSEEALAIGMQLNLASDDLASDFGHLTLKDTD
jgi:hypothetical protein